jgi:hypothetical protein
MIGWQDAAGLSVHFQLPLVGPALSVLFPTIPLGVIGSAEVRRLCLGRVAGAIKKVVKGISSGCGCKSIKVEIQRYNVTFRRVLNEAHGSVAAAPCSR